MEALNEPPGDRETQRKPQAQGWTMAAALIQFQKAKVAAQEARDKRRQELGEIAAAVADAEGEGVVVFDTETTRLIDAHTRLEEMEVSCACAVRLPTREGVRRADALEKGEWKTFWHTDAHTSAGTNAETGMQGLLAWMDQAKVIVCYNGHGFDMRVLQAAYAGDEERRAAHLAKLHDPMVEALRRSECKRAPRLSHLLRLNGRGGKLGTGSDAPGLYADQRFEALARYCRRDVEALAELVLQDTVRLPGGTDARGATVWAALDTAHEQKRGRSSMDAAAAEDSGAQRRRSDGGGAAESEAEDNGEESPRTAEERERSGASAGQASTQNDGWQDEEAEQHSGHSDGGRSEAPETAGSAQGGSGTQRTEENGERSGAGGSHEQRNSGQHTDSSSPQIIDLTQGSGAEDRQTRGKRKAGGYSETQRRGKRAKAVCYLERGVTHVRKGTKREAIVTGPHTVERVVQGQYDWTSPDLRRNDGRRKRLYSEYSAVTDSAEANENGHNGQAQKLHAAEAAAPRAPSTARNEG